MTRPEGPRETVNHDPVVLGGSQMEAIRQKVIAFVIDDLLLGDKSRSPELDDSLVETGVIDSTGILELIEFLESELGVHVEDAETIPANLDSVNRITGYVAAKTGVGSGGPAATSGPRPGPEA